MLLCVKERIPPLHFGLVSTPARSINDHWKSFFFFFYSIKFIIFVVNFQYFFFNFFLSFGTKFGSNWHLLAECMSKHIDLCPTPQIPPHIKMLFPYFIFLRSFRLFFHLFPHKWRSKQVKYSLLVAKY